MFYFLSWISVTLLWAISAGLWLFRHSCRLKGWWAERNCCPYLFCLFALVKSQGQVFERDRFPRAHCQRLWLLSAQFPPKGSQQALFSCFPLEMYWETEILRNAAMWYSNLQAIYWTLWFRLAWRSKVTFLKALSCLCSIVETQSFTRSQHQVCWFSMAAWCTWELQFHSQCTYHKFTPKKKTFPIFIGPGCCRAYDCIFRFYSSSLLWAETLLAPK